MSEAFKNYINNFLETLNTYIDYYSKIFLDTFYSILYGKHEYSKTKKRKIYLERSAFVKKSTPYVYYTYVSIWKFIWISTCIILLLLVVFFIKDSCQNITSDNHFKRLIESLQCTHITMFAVIIIIITISYILGGYIRLIGMIGFIIIAISLLFNPRNMDKITKSIRDIYDTIKQLINSKENPKKNELDSNKKITTKKKTAKKKQVSKDNTTINQQYNSYPSSVYNPFGSNVPYPNMYNVPGQFMYP